MGEGEGDGALLGSHDHVLLAFSMGPLGPFADVLLHVLMLPGDWPKVGMP